MAKLNVSEIVCKLEKKNKREGGGKEKVSLNSRQMCRALLTFLGKASTALGCTSLSFIHPPVSLYGGLIHAGPSHCKRSDNPTES